MKLRTISKHEAERAFTAELSGDAFHRDDRQGVIVAIHLPQRPLPGGGQGRGFLPLTYEVRTDSGVETVYSEEGPEVDEARAFLYATVRDRQPGERFEFWFEAEPGELPENVSCCC